MIQKSIFFLVVMIPLFFISCDDGVSESTDTGNWISYSEYEGVTRSGAIAFSVGNFSYVGLGSDGSSYLQDFWRYDSEKNFWQQMASFPGVGRISAAAFSVGTKGYVGTGYNGDLNDEELGDFWEYDTETDTWTEKTAFLGTARYSAVGFSLSDKGYIGTGFDGNYLKDFWSYDPATDSWSQIVSLYGSKREDAVAFVIEDKAYVGTGQNNGSYLYDFWAYDPESDTWDDLSLNDEDTYFDEFILAMARYGASAMTIQGKGYIVSGISSAYTGTVYSYDPETQIWEDDLTALEGSARSGAVSFSIGDVGYICTGRNSSQRFDDIWGFYPDAEYNEYD